MLCRSLLATVVLTAILGLPAAFAGLNEYQDAVNAETNLISYFTFDDDSGTTVSDTFTTALPDPSGTLQGTAAFTADGEGFGGAGQALSLTGTGWVTFGAVAEFAFGGQSAELATPGTVEMWVRPSWDPLTPPSYNPTLASVREYTSGDPNPATRWSLHVDADRLGAGPYGGIMGYHPGDWDFRADEWYHLVMVFTPNYKGHGYPITRMFVNGIWIRPSGDEQWGYLGAATSAPFQIGAADPNGTRAFIGRIDEVAIYSAELSDASIIQHYLAGRGFAPPTAPLPIRAGYAAAVMADAPIGYYSFEGDTTAVTDNSGNGHNGTITPPTYWSAGFAGGQALALDCSGQSGGMVSMGAVDAFKLVEETSPGVWTGVGTIEAWIAPTPGLEYRWHRTNPDGTFVWPFNFDWNFGKWRPTILSSADDFSSLFHYGLELRIGDQTLALETYNTGYNATAQPFPLPWVAEEKWYHLAAVFSGGTVNYYVDGQQAGVQTAIDATPPVGFTGLFQIGAGSPAADWGFPGKIDEVAIYDTALSPERIGAHYGSVAMTFDIHEIEFIDPTNLTPVNATLSAPAGQSSSGLELTFSFSTSIVTVSVDIPGYGAVPITPGTAYPIPDGLTSAVLTVTPVSGGYGTTTLTATPNAASGWLAGDSIQIDSSLVIVGGMYVNDDFDDNAVGTNVNGVGGGWYVPYQAKGAPSEADSSLKILGISGWYVWTGISSKPAGDFPFMNADGIRIEWVIDYVQLTAVGGGTESGWPNAQEAECFHELGVLSANADRNSFGELFRNTEGGLYVNLYYSGYVDSPTENITVKGSVRVVNSTHPTESSGDGANGIETPVVFELTNVHSITPAKPLVVTIELDQNGWKVGFSQNAGAVYSVWPTGTSRPGISFDTGSGKVLGGWGTDSLGEGLAGAAITDEFNNGAFLFAAVHNIVNGNGQGWIDSVKACVDCPLATDCPNPFADADADGDVDQTDFAQLQACFTGTGGGIPGGCGCLDHDGSGSIDSPDLDAFEICATGAGIPAAKACDDQ
jgi:hypothetical protein